MRVKLQDIDRIESRRDAVQVLRMRLNETDARRVDRARTLARRSARATKYAVRGV